MVSGLINANPIVYEKKERRARTEPGDVDEDIKDPEHPYSLEELKVITEDAIEVDDKHNCVRVTFTPTVEHCSMATVIGLCLRVKLMRSLPLHYKMSTIREHWDLGVDKVINPIPVVKSAVVPEYMWKDES
ncbi:hypothetical protein TEA_004322 [Camellia sinensis var. sinensis]|uniref:MIP18 family-like domain-containing protein n=1 Tax=Camellia sinensis var. sinensis TaxID=542762 RepID=A0A4S4DHU9_CAMSN|nr:hypothetical protein TEA_004322 [Camellia sinensis var. sinensis]